MGETELSGGALYLQAHPTKPYPLLPTYLTAYLLLTHPSLSYPPAYLHTYLSTCLSAHLPVHLPAYLATTVHPCLAPRLTSSQPVEQALGRVVHHHYRFPILVGP